MYWKYSPEARQVEFDAPSMVKPAGQEYRARWPNSKPSFRNDNGGIGVGGSGQEAS